MVHTSASPATIEAARNTSPPQTIAADRLVGAEAIGKFIDPRLTPRETRRLLEEGYYPCWREGRAYVASKAALLAHWQEMTTGTFSPPPPKKRPDGEAA
jgi:hypothetical protein